jgi:hypothetical protein
MSIIQEALKKAQGQTRGSAATDAKSRGSAEPGGSAKPEAARAAAPGSPAIHPPAKTNDKKTPAVLLVILVVVAAIAVNRLFPGKNISAGKTGVVRPDINGSAEVGIVKKPEMAGETKPLKPEDFSALPSIVFQRPEEKKAYQAEFILNGIMYLEGSPRAIINDAMVGIDDTVSGAKVIKIEKRYVVLQYNGAEITLDLK